MKRQLGDVRIEFVIIDVLVAVMANAGDFFEEWFQNREGEATALNIFENNVKPDNRHW